MSLSIVVPAKNEEKNIANTFKKIKTKLSKYNIKYEIIVIDDFSNDKTIKILKNLKNKNLYFYKNSIPGVGNAVKYGILKSKNKYICIFMADASDDINDLIIYYKLINRNNLDAVFGSRFLKKSKIKNYPFLKLVLNRIFNKFVQLLTFSSYNDFTNAFKMYRRSKLLKIFPLKSKKFEIFLEIPLKFYIKKNRINILPINWTGRKLGISKFVIKELSLSYLRILINCLIKFYKI